MSCRSTAYHGLRLTLAFAARVLSLMLWAACHEPLHRRGRFALMLMCPEAERSESHLRYTPSCTYPSSHVVFGLHGLSAI
jgi:hypothetical protein